MNSFPSIAGDGALDRLGVFASCACALHCLATPFIVALLPLSSLAILEGPLTEWFFVSTSIAIGLSSLVSSYARKHRKRRPLFFFIIGLGLILTARLVFDDSLPAEIPFVMFGALFVTVAHLLNRKLCRTCVMCTDECL